jgi:signal transduction histidine kinase
MTVRNRLQLWNTGVLALTLIVLGVTVRWAVHENLYRAVDQELISQLQTTKSLNRRMNERETARKEKMTDEEEKLINERDGLRDKFREINEKLLKIRPLDSNNEPSEPESNTIPRFINSENKPIRFGPFRVRDPWDWKTTASVIETQKPKYSTVVVQGERLRLYTGHTGILDGKPVFGQFAFRLADIDRGMAAVDRTLLILLPISLLLTSLIGAFLTRKAIQPIEDALESEREALAKQKRFVADASHELKTPLAIIKAAVGLGLDTATGSTLKTYERIDSATNRTTRIVNDLMLLAQSDNDQIAPQKTRIPAASFLAETIVLFDERHGERAITATAAPDLQLHADAHQLGRALANLLDNAIRHTKDDGKITLVAKQEGNKTVITLTDDGEGIAPEHLPHLFERFYRVDSARARKDGGTGLGLAITRSLIEAQGGTLTLTSKPEEGTMATITLPD